MFERRIEGSSNTSSGKNKASSWRECSDSDNICQKPGCETCAKKIQDRAWYYVITQSAYNLLINYGNAITTLYGAIDGINLSYSLIKCILEVTLYNSQALITDVMHDFLLTPEGIIIAAATGIAFIILAVAVNRGELKSAQSASAENSINAPDAPEATETKTKTPSTEDPQAVTKAHLDMLWRCIRGIVKSFKNIKGFRTVLQLAIFLGATNTAYLILPLTLGLGAFSILNRLYILYIQDERKRMKKENDEYLDNILKAIKAASFKDKIEQKKKIQNQPWSSQALAMISAGLGGALNNPYLYMGFLVSLFASVSWPIFVAMVSFCTFYCVLHFITSMYEEYDYQRDLKITAVRAELAELGWELMATLDAAEETQTQEQFNAYYRKIEEFKKKRKEYHGLVTLSSTSAFLYGLFNGLYVYRALAAFMSLLLLISPALPPVLLVVAISMGLFLLVAFTVHAYRHYSNHRAKQKEQEAADSLDFLTEDSTDKNAKKMRKLRGIIKKETDKQLEQLWVKDGAETARLGSAAPIKGEKIVSGYIGTPALEADEHGHWINSNPILILLAIISSLIQAVIVPARYLVKIINERKNRQPKTDISSPADAADDATTSPEVLSPELNTEASDSSASDASEVFDDARDGLTPQDSPTLGSELPKTTPCIKVPTEEGYASETDSFVSACSRSPTRSRSPSPSSPRFFSGFTPLPPSADVLVPLTMSPSDGRIQEEPDGDHSPRPSPRYKSASFFSSSEVASSILKTMTVASGAPSSKIKQDLGIELR